MSQEGERSAAVKVALKQAMALYQEDPSPKNKATVEALARAVGRQTPDPSKTSAAIRGATQGASLYFGDELGGAAMAAMGQGEGETFGERRQYNTAEQRANNAAAEQAHPMTYLAGELVGGTAIPGGAAVSAARTAQRTGSWLRPLGQSMAAGGLAGGIASQGLQEGGESMSDQLYDGLFGATTGAVGGPAIGGLVQKAGELGGTVIGGLARNIGSSSEDVAQRRAGRLLRDDGIDSAEGARARLDALGPEGRLADVGGNLQTEAVRIAQSPGPGQNLARDYVGARQRGQESRLEQLARETVDPSWTDYRGFVHELSEQQTTQTADLYARAYLQPIMPSPTLVALSSENKVFQAALRKGISDIEDDISLDNALARPGEDGSVSTVLMDYTMRALSDDVSRAFRNGERSEGRRLKQLYNQVQREVFDQNPTLAEARSAHRGAEELKEAASYGRELIGGGKKVREDEFDDYAELWSDSEWEAARVGMLQGIFDRISDVATTGDSARRLVSSSRLERILAKAFKEEGAYERFMQSVDAESKMQGTRNMVESKNITYRMQAADPNLPTAQDTPARTFVYWAQNLIRKIAADDPDFGDLRPKDYEELAKLLFGEVDDRTLQNIIAPTLKFRLRDGPHMGNIGVGTGSVPVLEAGRQNMFATEEQ
jgi:hypothetical protein